jgi:hypothetical protein
MTRRLAAIGVLVALAITLDGCAYPGRPAANPDTQVKYLGVYEQNILSTYRLLSQFAAETGRAPNIVLYYSSCYESLKMGIAERAQAHRAVPLVQIDQFRSITQISVWQQLRKESTTPACGATRPSCDLGGIWS